MHLWTRKSAVNFGSHPDLDQNHAGGLCSPSAFVIKMITTCVDVYSCRHRSWTRCSTYISPAAIATMPSPPINQPSPFTMVRRCRSVTAAVVAAPCWDSISARLRTETMPPLDPVRFLLALRPMPATMHSNLRCVSDLCFVMQ